MAKMGKENARRGCVSWLVEPFYGNRIHRLLQANHPPGGESLFQKKLFSPAPFCGKNRFKNDKTGKGRVGEEGRIWGGADYLKKKKKKSQAIYSNDKKRIETVLVGKVISTECVNEGRYRNIKLNFDAGERLSD